jgi:hypothetical protein
MDWWNVYQRAKVFLFTIRNKNFETNKQAFDHTNEMASIWPGHVYYKHFKTIHLYNKETVHRGIHFVALPSCLNYNWSRLIRSIMSWKRSRSAVELIAVLYGICLNYFKMDESR